MRQPGGSGDRQAARWCEVVSDQELGLGGPIGGSGELCLSPSPVGNREPLKCFQQGNGWSDQRLLEMD